MPELVQVYAPTRTLPIWKSLLNWLTFFFQIFLQILKGTPCVNQVQSYFGLRNSSLLSSSPQFKPLPVVEEVAPPSAVALSTLQITAGSVPISVEEERLPRLTAPFRCHMGSPSPSQSSFKGTKTSSLLARGAAFCPFPSLLISPEGQLSIEVVLDLDETLICAYETSSLPTIICTQATEAGLKWFELECVSSEKEYDGKPKINYVTVFERPGLHEFLKQLSEFANLVLFTAGLEGYARPVVDKIDLENRFSHRLYRPSTTSTEFREHVKDLSCISEDLCRIVIVDNNPFSFLLQPLNGIPCIPFSPGQPHDDQLLEVILPLLKHLSEQKDVRPVLRERFQMPEWFQNHGIPTCDFTNV